jgi:YesN/AraC family two-component response regulator
MTEEKTTVDTVLFVDDEVSILHSIERLVFREPYRKLYAESGPAALEILEKESVQVIVTDLRMPEMDGLSLLRIIKEKWPDVLRLVLTGYTQVPQILATINSGEVYRYLTKPLGQSAELVVTLRQALEYQNLRRDRVGLVQQLEKHNRELEAAMSEIRQLQGMLPICSCCKKIRDEKGYWEQIESYISNHTEAVFSHGICPECMETQYPEFAKEINEAGRIDDGLDRGASPEG